MPRKVDEKSRCRSKALLQSARKKASGFLLKIGASGASPLRRWPRECCEDLKAGISELKEQLETLEEEGRSIMQIAKQGRNERGQRFFELFRQGEEEVCTVQFGEMEHAIEAPSGAGKAMSRHDAGSEAIE